MFPCYTNIVGCGHEIVLPSPPPRPEPTGYAVVEGCGHIIVLDPEPGFVGHPDGAIDIR